MLGRHATLLDKIAQLDMPDEVYNWMVNFFSGHSHCIHHLGEESAVSEVTASIVQGSSIGPASYVVNTADLKAVTPGINRMIKFADDTYIVTPAANANSRQAELDSVEEWSRTNNLKVNPIKYVGKCHAQYFHARDSFNIRHWCWWMLHCYPPFVGKDDLGVLRSVDFKVVRPRPFFVPPYYSQRAVFASL